MFGCLRRLGCLVLLVIGVGLYLLRDSWWPLVRPMVRAEPEVVARERGESGEGGWESLDPEKAARGERAVRALATRGGPAYVSLQAGELTSYAFLSLADALPVPLDDAQAAVVGDRVFLRSVVSLRDLGGSLGPVANLLPERDTLRLGGTFEVVRPGLAQFRVREASLGNVPLPSSVLPRVLRRTGASGGSEVASDAVGIPLPPYIGDVRVARGRITLYKAVP
jgi:hypothetical protein